MEERKSFELRVTKLGKMAKTLSDWKDWLNQTLNVTDEDLRTLENTINEYKPSSHLSDEHAAYLKEFYALYDQAVFKQKFPNYGNEYLRAVNPLQSEDPEIRYHGFLRLYRSVDGNDTEKLIAFLDNIDPALLEELKSRYYLYDDGSPEHTRDLMEGYGVEQFFERFK